MRVVTFDTKAFGDACRSLGRQAEAAGFVPQLIVGIRRGGEYVAWEIRQCFPESRLASVSLQRPSTGTKSRCGPLLRSFLRYMPRRILDLMRIIEARWLSKPHKNTVPAEPLELPSTLCGLGTGRVLLVDDAVDSGATMLRVIEALRRENPQIDLRTAAITVTTSSPVVQPDYSIYNNLTLIRFPWSIDSRKQTLQTFSR